jgi:hypothetical protein
MATPAAKTSPERNAVGATLIGPLKDQIAILALLVTLAGLASTEAYYARFDLQYQFLGLPASHIVYRGIGIVWSHLYVALPYVLASAWLLVLASRPTPLRSEQFQLVLTYLMILVVTVATYGLAWMAGLQDANRDRIERTSTLPRIMAATLKDEAAIDAAKKYRLLLIAGDTIVIFQPLAEENAAKTPLIKRIAKDAVRTIETVR